jgi:hypothetical protein
MDEKWNPEPIKRLLNRSIAQLDRSTRIRLHAARTQALERHAARSAALPSWAWANVHIVGHASGHHHRIYYLIGTLLLAVCIFSGVAYWQQATDNDTADLDIAILTDDLPIQYFLD